ncbi:peptidylprolyl isomerase [Nonlabens xiamenensis]|uniref:peptidylprolyl isomerase n=1 Tax=Nonlabens xiamenensis TaxID=2341043 RepID=UPI000F60C756|nr:peptidylprolyl isomerase [Nonlabens xiamenensis]
MAILGKIRNQGVILILVIALALFAFIIQGVLTSGGQKQGNAVGYVGDTEISFEEFGRKVDNYTQRANGITTVQAVNTLWEQEVRDAVLEQQIQEAGVAVTDEQVADLVKDAYRSNPQFQNEDGSFSEAKFKTFIDTQFSGTNASIWNDYVNGQAKTARQNQFFNLLKSGLIATAAEGEMEYRMENDKRSFQYVNIPYTSIPDSTVEVTKAEIEAYVEDHKKQFEVEAQRDLQFVLFEDKASQADKDALKAELSKRLTAENQVYNENTKQYYDIPAFSEAEDVELYVNQYSEESYDPMYTMVSKLPAPARKAATAEIGSTVGPYQEGEMMKLALIEDKKTINDSVQNRHILVAYAGATRSQATRTKEEAEKVADSILATIGQSKSVFDSKFDYFKENTEVAKAEDIGWVVYSGNAKNFAPGFTEFLFSNEEGTIGIAESSFGYHIIRIDEAKAPEEAVKLATISKKIYPSKKTGNDIYTKTVKFQQAAEKGDFTALAKDNNVVATPVSNLKPLDETLPTIGKNRSIVKWAFEEDTEVGDVKRFETAQGFVVAKVTGANEAGNMSSEEASAKVTPILRKNKKARMIMDKIQSNDLSTIAKNQSQVLKTASQISRKNPTIPGAGDEPLVVGTAFGLAQDATSKPIKGDTGVFVIKVTEITDAPDLQNYASNANTLANQAANQSTSKLVEALKKSVEIEDNRVIFY